MRYFLLTALFLTSLPHWAGAQTSIGYSDPADVSTLLDYRLPDWSYRTWDADFRFSGNGNDSRRAGAEHFGNSSMLLLGSNYFQAWENEQNQWSITADVDGRYSRSHAGSPDRESQNHDLIGDFDWAGDLKHYLGAGPFSIRLNASSGRSYVERVRSNRVGDIWTDFNTYDRQYRNQAIAGLGWGRVRNVEPMLRAQRLSERLVALGRPPLKTAQLHEVAAAWSQLPGYLDVYDRYGRHFWDDVLTPMIDLANPLSAYEVLYLMDSMRENLGTRRQGVEVATEVVYTEQSRDGSIGDHSTRTRMPRLSVSAYRNLSLSQQIHLTARYAYVWANSNERTNDRGSADVTLAHLWNLTDRYLLETALDYRGSSEIQQNVDQQRASLGTNFHIFLEDQLSLYVNANATYNWDKWGDRENLAWNWSYGVGLLYHLDRAIF